MNQREGETNDCKVKDLEGDEIRALLLYRLKREGGGGGY